MCAEGPWFAPGYGRGDGRKVILLHIYVWAGISYGQPTQLHVIKRNLNAQKYCDEVLRPIYLFIVNFTTFSPQFRGIQLF
jgi:hypothetical protein